MKKYSIFGFLLIVACLLVACGNESTNQPAQSNTETSLAPSTKPSEASDIVVTTVPTQTSDAVETPTPAENINDASIDVDVVSNDSLAPTQTPNVNLRDNTPVCLVPTADGITSYSTNVSTLDVSNASEGYVIADYYGNSSKVKFRITGSDGIVYTYDLHGGKEVFPLSAGSGNYDLGIYEVIENSQYSVAQFETISVTISNTFGPFLYPNQYVTFDINSNAVAKARDLVATAESDLDAVTYIYNYIIENITYDYDKATSVQSGYLPYPDELLESKTGICLDYASLMTAMLRSQRIPTRMEIGYVGEAYHAWISTYITDIGWVNGIIEFDGKNWKLMDPTFAASVPGEDLENFIGDGSSYLTKYIY